MSDSRGNAGGDAVVTRLFCLEKERREEEEQNVNSSKHRYIDPVQKSHKSHFLAVALPAHRSHARGPLVGKELEDNGLTGFGNYSRHGRANSLVRCLGRLGACCIRLSPSGHRRQHSHSTFGGFQSTGLAGICLVGARCPPPVGISPSARLISRGRWWRRRAGTGRGRTCDLIHCAR